MKYNKEEQEIIDAFDADELKLSKTAEEDIELIKSAAGNTFKKNKRVTIRLYEHDFAGIQKKALEMGIPYQTLISGIIHRYVEGDLKAKGS
jgi:predicted DNA binding CopG/RHH family protein